MCTHAYMCIFFNISVFMSFEKNPVCVAYMSAISKIHSQSATWRSVKLIMKHIVQAYTLGT